MKNVLVLFIVALVAVVGFGAEVPTVLTGTDTPPDVLPAPAVRPLLIYVSIHLYALKLTLFIYLFIHLSN